MAGIARIYDLYGPGGFLVGNESGDVTVNGKPVALSPCLFTPHPMCPINKLHCIGVVFGFGRGVTVNGQTPLTLGSKGTCGHSVLMASTNVIIK